MTDRLISFGCSYTYGEGLSDKSDAWPFVLGNLMSIKVINQAISGSGNLEILWNILNYKFEFDDLCVVMWSHFSRDHIFHPVKHQRIQIDSDDVLTKHWILTHTDYDQNVRNWLYIQHCDLYLKSKNVKVYHLIGGSYDRERFSNPKCINLSNILDIQFENFDFTKDGHPGLKSHRILAERIYNSVNGLISHK